MDAVHRYEGYVAQALGDGIFALFGAPLAHEDHPQRALYAALRMQEEMRRYGDTLRTKGYPPLLDAGGREYRAKWCCARFAKTICMPTMSRRAFDEFSGADGTTCRRRAPFSSPRIPTG